MIKILFSTEEEKEDINRLELAVASDYHSFHIRKPNWSKEELISYILSLPKDWRDRAVLHSHFDLVEQFELKGIHLNEVNRRKGIAEKNSPLIVSTSFHSIADILNTKASYSYAFLSPIFDSISKQGYKSGFTFEELQAVNLQSKHHLIALGGITSENFKCCESLGFYGVALLGSFWYS